MYDRLYGIAHCIFTTIVLRIQRYWTRPHMRHNSRIANPLSFYPTVLFNVSQGATHQLGTEVPRSSRRICVRVGDWHVRNDVAFGKDTADSAVVVDRLVYGHRPWDWGRHQNQLMRACVQVSYAHVWPGAFLLPRGHADEGSLGTWLESSLLFVHQKLI